jgi:nitrous oxidase accessory protein
LFNTPKIILVLYLKYRISDILFIGIIFYSGIFIPSNSTFVTISANNFSQKASILETGSIVITGNEELRLTANSSGWSGNGTKDNPFIISGYTIDVSSGDGIALSSTSDFVIISKNTINTHEAGRGIVINSGSNIYIANNTIFNSTFGIMVYSSQIVIENNSIFSNKNGGIRLQNSNNCLLVNNRLQDNKHSSIDIISSSFVNITNNFVFNTIFVFTQSGDYGSGVYVKDSSYIRIISNILSKNTEPAIFINENSQYNLIESNLLNGNGIDIAFIAHHTTIRNNTILNARIGIFSGNYNGGFQVIENNSIYYSTFYAIGVGGTNNIVRHNDIYGSPNGLLAEDSNGNEFYGNSLENITEYDIHVRNLNSKSNNNKFYSNTFRDSLVEVSIENSLTTLDGNYWANYNGFDSNNDGFGDEKYTISNINGYSTFVSDLHPLMKSEQRSNLTKYEIAINILEKAFGQEIIRYPSIQATGNYYYQYGTTTSSYNVFSSISNNYNVYTISERSSNGIGNISLLLLIGLLIILIISFAVYRKRELNFDYEPKSSPIQKITFCRNCGTKTMIDDNFCEHCGKRL